MDALEDDDEHEIDYGTSQNDDDEDREPKPSSRDKEKEKEKTKLRERHRRSITTKILSGLRKYGNYNLPPRADINDVLRALANEAGWIVEADGTTYRNPALQQTSGASHSAWRQAMPHNVASFTPSLNSMGGFSCVPSPVITDPVDPTGGDCSTTASPRHISRPSVNLFHPHPAFSSPFTSGSIEGAQSVQFTNRLLVGGIPSGYPPGDGGDLLRIREETAATILSANMMEHRELGNLASTALLNPAETGFYPPQLEHMRYHTRATFPSVMMFSPQASFLQESRASNQNTPIGSPQPHDGNI